MGDPEEVVTIAFEQEAPPVHAVVTVPLRRTLCNFKYNLYDLCRLYEVGLRTLPAEEHDRWRTTFALAASTGGVWAVLDNQTIYALSVFWRTKNPHVNLRREFPVPDPDGTFLYVGWCWTQGWLVRDFKRYIVSGVASGIDYVAWHDQRAKLKRKARGRLFTWKMPEQPLGLKDVLAKRNGHPAEVGR